jgi:hypothetical protein
MHTLRTHAFPELWNSLYKLVCCKCIPSQPWHPIASLRSLMNVQYIWAQPLEVFISGLNRICSSLKIQHSIHLMCKMIGHEPIVLLTCAFLKNQFPLWFAQHGRLLWPPRSPNLTTCALWSSMTVSQVGDTIHICCVYGFTRWRCPLTCRWGSLKSVHSNINIWFEWKYPSSWWILSELRKDCMWNNIYKISFKELIKFWQKLVLQYPERIAKCLCNKYSFWIC